MCILAVKKNYNGIDLVFARDEKKNREYLEYGTWWNLYPQICGYKDLEKGGTWLANNNHLFACILNQESNDRNTDCSRGEIILNLLSKSDNIDSARLHFVKNNYSYFLPFNLIVIDKKNRILFIRNRCGENKTTVISDIDIPFFMLNRSFLNDFSQHRIAANYTTMFNHLSRGINYNRGLYEYLLKETYCRDENDEHTIKLIADNWETQVISLVHICSKDITVNTLYSINYQKY